MLKRKIEQALLDWKQREDRKPLIVKGHVCMFHCGLYFYVLF